MSFKDKVAVVTGAGSGIGASIAKRLAKEGAKVIVSDLVKQSALLTCDHIINRGGIAKGKRTDVTDPEGVDDLMAFAIEQYSRLDILICSAGVINNNRTKTADHSLEDWNNIIAVNQSGLFYCMKYALQIMTKQGSGNIVNVASLAGLIASKDNIAYTASKFAVVGMTKSAALEYGRSNIRINCVCPSYTNSPMLEKATSHSKEYMDKLREFTPMGRFAEPAEIAEAIMWLASEKTKFITGQCITLDGGISL